MPAPTAHRPEPARPLVLVILAALAAVLLGCAALPGRAPGAAARSLRIADAELDAAPRDTSAEEALADLEHARYAFEQAYAGVDGAPRVPAAAALDAARARLAARPRWTGEDLARLLRDVFATPDGHLAFGHGGPRPLRLSAGAWRQPFVSAPIDRIDADGAIWLGDRKLVGCDVARRGGAIVPTPSGQLVLGLFGASGGGDAEARVACFLGAAGAGAPVAVPLHPSQAEPVDDGRAPVELVRGEVPVLAIRTFDSAADAALRDLPALAEELRRTRRFIVDLRGNTGGNYMFAERFVLALTDGPVRRLDEREVVSVAAAEGRANGVRRRLARGDVPASARPRFLAQRDALEQLAEALRAEGAPREDLTTPGRVIRGTAPGPLRGRAVFLVDGGCASACEMMLALARQIPGVVVAGQNTRGGMAVGEIALFQLPRSRVTISLGTRAFRDPLGDFAETRGFVPDVWIDGDGALSGAKQLALGGPGAELRPRGERLAQRPDAARRARPWD